MSSSIRIGADPDIGPPMDGSAIQVGIQISSSGATSIVSSPTDDAGHESLAQPATHEATSARESNGEILTTFSFRRRNRGKTGPDYCMSLSTETAVTKAISTAKERPGEPVFFPYVGTICNSFEEAKELYNLYSWEIGFGIRESRSKVNGNDYTTRKDLVCSCQGFCDNPQAASARTGCRAMIRLHRTENHGWVISQLVTEHNHPLSTTCGQKKQWGSHGEIDSVTKEMIRKLRSNNVSLSRVCNIIGASATDPTETIRKQSIRSICGKIAQEEIKNDMNKTLDLLRQMQNEDKELEVRFKSDANGQLESMIWCTGKNKEDYKHFGDVMTFDTTYRTNLYDLPFGIFVGVNNHFQSIIFGGVLLDHERIEDFEWAFSNFKDIMGMRQPRTILTDQCQAMAAAIKTTMPGTRHRWCKWHVLRNAKPKIGPSYSKKSAFKKKFHKLLNDEVSPSVFEMTWHNLIQEYKLQENKFLDRAFRTRGMWAKPYFMDVFCAGMTSTQRSESANHMLKNFIPRGAPMHVFVSKFRELQYGRNQDEEREKWVTNQMSRRIRFGVPIEHHAEELYTRGVHNIFCSELFESGAYTINSKSQNEQQFVLVHVRAILHESPTKHTVILSGFDKISCSCGFFKHTGLLCRHSLKVLLHQDRTEVPKENITHRWTKGAGPLTETIQPTKSLESLMQQTSEIKKRIIIRKALELSEAKITDDDSALNEALRAINNVMVLPTNREQSHGTSSPMMQKEGCISGVEKTMITCPPRRKRTGAPIHNSIKSWKNNKTLEKEFKRAEGKENKEGTCSAAPNTSSKTRTLADLFHVTTKST